MPAFHTFLAFEMMQIRNIGRFYGYTYFLQSVLSLYNSVP